MEPLPGNSTCRVAVLPFLERGGYPRGAELFYKVFSAELVSAAAFQLVQEGDILDLYRQLTIFPSQEPNLEQLRIIGSRLGVQLFIGGDILKMVERRSGGEVVTELTVVLRLYDGRTGKLLWETYHKRCGRDYRTVMHFGRINTITGLARRMSKEIINLWLEQGMNKCIK
ncbi:MAG: hypothetical protein GXP57_05920 [Deltaproteobacteria bacterium]|nr:hypothetical protein [Deltaproteobacteria bacterium]